MNYPNCKSVDWRTKQSNCRDLDICFYHNCDHYDQSKAVAEIERLRDKIARLTAVLQTARAFVADELAARIGRHTTDGDMATLIDAALREG